MTALAALDPAPPPVVLEDPGLPHQIVLFLVANQTAVSCNCLARPGCKGWVPVGARKVFPAADAVACWRAWHRERGVAV